MPLDLVYRVQAESPISELADSVFIGKKTDLTWENVRLYLTSEIDEAAVRGLLEKTAPGETSQFWAAKGSRQLIFGALPTESSRCNCPLRPDIIADFAAKVPRNGTSRIVVFVRSEQDALVAAAAIARPFSTYSRKTGKITQATIHVHLHGLGCKTDVSAGQIIANAVRLAGHLVDQPTSELNTDSIVELARMKCASLKNVDCTVIRGSELEEKGFGGLWGVGKGAAHPPALVVLSYRPPDAKKTIAWVGKGIVFDTGGLCIKSREGMIGMKRDMGGAGTVLAAFEAAVLLGTKHNLYAVLCLAENAVSEKSTRPDDILTLYSGKTVEVNNTDAEGRLVLGDGVAYVTKHLNPDIVVDLATLTGAQGIATGKRHAGILCNDEELEHLTVDIGRRTGDLVHPLVYCPEFFLKEFKSEIADMKNSVKDRENAQSSCAGHFIEQHLDASFRGKWLHVDFAAPVAKDERGTGYGVNLLLGLLNAF